MEDSKPSLGPEHVSSPGDDETKQALSPVQFKSRRFEMFASPGKSSRKPSTSKSMNTFGFDSDEDEPAATETEDQRKDQQMLAFFGHKQAAHYSKEISLCDGNDPAKTLIWLRAVQATPEPTQVAPLVARGQLLQFILHHHKVPWDLLFICIAKEFVNYRLRERQQDELENLRQRPGEPLRKFNFEFEQLLKEAYDTLPTDQSHLVRIYLSALADRDSALRVLQENEPKTLSDAMKAVTQLSRSGELLRPQKAMRKAHIVDAVPTESSLEKAVTALVTSQKHLAEKLTAMEMKLKSPIKGNKKSKISVLKTKLRCYNCGKAGHFTRECQMQSPPSKKSDYQKQSSANFDQPKCRRCRQFTHKTEHCQAPPPKNPCHRCGGQHWLHDCKDSLNS